MTGLSDVMGSWNTKAISFPRTPLSAFGLMESRFVPLKEICPPTILPGGDGTSWRIDRTPTVLPLPLSPTMARHSPLSTEYEIPLTAFTTPSTVKNLVCRSFTSSSIVTGPSWQEAMCGSPRAALKALLRHGSRGKAPGSRSSALVSSNPLSAFGPFQCEGVPLIQQRFVQDIFHPVRPAREIFSKVVTEDFSDAGILSLHRAGRMRTDEDVRDVPKRAVGRQWFLSRDVKGREANVAGPQVVDQGGLVHHRSPRNVDEHTAGFHGSERRPVDHRVGVGS